MTELRRRCTAAKAWGIPAELVTPGEVRKLVPYLDESVILGGAHFPTVGVVDSLRAGTLMREQAEQAGALHGAGRGPRCSASTSTGGRARPPGARRCAPAPGEIETDVVRDLLRRLEPADRGDGRRADPAHPDRAPDDQRRPDRRCSPAPPGEIAYPIVRDVDTNMYERQHGGDMEVGSYAHRPIIVGAGRHPLHRGVGAARRPSCRSPRTTSTRSWPQALELMPELLGDERVGIRYAINGLISMTPDGHPLLGETPEVTGLWSAAASWIKEGPGSRPGGGRVDERPGARRSTCTRPTSPGSTRTSAPPRTCAARAARGLQQDVRDRAPGRAVGVRPAGPGQPGLRPRARARRGVLRDRRLGAAVLVRLERGRCWSGTRDG